MSKIYSFSVAAALALGAGGAFAQGVPGAAALVENSTVVVSGNKAKDITVGGTDVKGSASGGKGLLKFFGASIEAGNGGGIANVNSINIEGSQIKNSTIAVTDNEAEGVKVSGGGIANVNSINIK